MHAGSSFYTFHSVRSSAAYLRRTIQKSQAFFEAVLKPNMR